MFLATALLWGGGALATTMQAGVTAPAWSVALRMAFAGALFFAAAAMRATPMTVPPKDRLYVFLQGALFFALGFIAFYESTRRIPSGLSTVILSTSSLFAVFASRIFLGTPLKPATIFGALFGVAGVAAIFLPGMSSPTDGFAAGIGWAFVAAISTAFGTLMGSRNQKAGLPVLTALGWAAIAGSVVSAGWALVSGTPYVADLSKSYWLSLIYLAVAASFVAFLIYFDLVRRIGPGGAAYALVTVPAVALVFSALFEGLRLDALMLLGVVLILIGNVIVVRG